MERKRARLVEFASRYEKLPVIPGCTIVEKNDIRYVSTECSCGRSGTWYPRKG
ncbi:hypothetical protein ALC60_03387 [Trachymyrmex zeteki]|uniref:Uncharacterized protein n=1 Tax=Mycetomoellerius zeteki TaxID=64791 RepID=A0A151XAN2_9HYME|nr:hypothetical protein ALC60_03387 [Trachymyrmex zeteki]